MKSGKAHAMLGQLNSMVYILTAPLDKANFTIGKHKIKVSHGYY